MILLVLFIPMFTLQRIFVESMQTTFLLEERIEKLERKGIEQEAIIQKLLTDMQEQRKEMKAQAEIIHEMSMKLDHQAKQLVQKEHAITQLESKLNETSNTKEYLTYEKSQTMSSDNFSQSSEDKRTMLNYESNIDSAYNYTNRMEYSTSMNAISIRQRRLNLPVPTQPPKMNIAFSVSHPSADFQTGPIVYDTVDMNLGGGFKPLSSNFTAPTNGLYLFSFLVSIISSPSKHTGFIAYVYKNNASLDMVFINSDNIENEQKSVTVITQLNVGDSVWVEILHAINVQSTTARFAGVLISQM
ncbi:C1q and tumor necrosis factor protein 4 [Mactra antiquata]